jgi:gliding motility-associated-like protein
MGNIIDEMYLTIYDRWGQKVFESVDQNDAWDGSFKGKALPPDVYGFYLQVKCTNGEEYFKKGNIALLK